MQIRNNSHLVVALALALVCIISFGSCSSKDKKVMSASKLEQVLYDYHFAEAMAADNDVDSLKATEYLESVFRKHGITQEEFDATMVYYLRHAYELNDIYSKVSDRINNEVQLQGLEGSSSISTDMNADTANIWNKEQSKVFNANIPYNLLKFSFKADSTYKSGDRFILKFKTNFLYQNGSRNGLALLSVRLKNDSVITRSNSLTTSSEYTLDITDVNNEGIKEISGFIMLRYGNYDTEKNSSALRMMFVDNITLVRMHKKKDLSANPATEPTTDNNNKTINEDEKTDSIKPHRADSVATPRRGLHKFHSR